MAGHVGITKELLGSSTSGRGIKLANTATTIHTSVASADGVDECWVWVWNTHTADVLLTIQMGGTTDPDDLIEYTVPFADGLHLVVPGLSLTGALDLKGLGATTNVLVAFGYVNRIWTATT